MRTRIALILVMVSVVGMVACVLRPVPVPPLRFPNGKRFAFSIVDDTDMTTLEKVRPVYRALERYGLRTTKTVWVYPSNDDSNHTNRGDSLANAEYRRFVLDLQAKGFEIALHGVRGGSSRRQDTIAGIEEFRKVLGRYPSMYVNHAGNKENLYWGRHLYTFAPYRWAGLLAYDYEFFGHDPASEYFWGDVAFRHIRYVRRFTFPHINLREVNPSFPYHLPNQPYVNYWFPTANGNRILEFDELLKTENLEKLNRDGGVCLVYSHLGMGSFAPNGSVDPRFERRLKELVKYQAWFAPASEILDYLRAQPGRPRDLAYRESLRLETLFLWFRIRQ